MTDQSRLAEIANEMIAAKGLADVWASIWAAMPTEARQKLATKMAEKMHESLFPPRDQWGRQDMLTEPFTRAASQLAQEVVDADRENILALVAKRLEATRESRVQAVVDMIAKPLVSADYDALITQIRSLKDAAERVKGGR